MKAVDEEPAIHIPCTCRYSFGAHSSRRWLGHNRACPKTRLGALVNKMDHNAFREWPPLIWRAVSGKRF